MSLPDAPRLAMFSAPARQASAARRSKNKRDAEVWRSARTFGDLCDLMARWCLGEFDENPGHSAPPMPETASIADRLAILNRAGLMTTQSQPGVALDSQGSGQRAFVDGYCSKATLRRIHDACLMTDLIVLFAPPLLPRARYWFRRDQAEWIPVTLDLGQPFTSTGNHGDSYRDVCAFWGDRCSDQAVDAVLRSCRVTVFDPRWGRADLLWNTLVAALTSREP